ncbi:MAG: FkbM family methyltransferase [Pseudomonadota bacterium]
MHDPNNDQTNRDAVLEVVRKMKPFDSGIPLVRYGGDFDGGYLLPNDFDGISACFSPGVSKIADFENDMARVYGMPCYMCDYSVDALPINHDLFDFEKVFLGKETIDEFMTLEDWIDQKFPEWDGQDFILQMDIEGAEYDVLPNISRRLMSSFRIIVLEIHYLRRELQPKNIAAFSNFIDVLTRDHQIVHLHPNNHGGDQSLATVFGIQVPRILELTLLRKDRTKQHQPIRNFPHRLDQKNVATKPDVVLPTEFYS